MKVLGDRRIPRAADVASMPLLKAVIKEITRSRNSYFSSAYKVFNLYTVFRLAKSSMGCFDELRKLLGYLLFLYYI